MVFVFPLLKKKKVHPEGMQPGMARVVFALLKIDREFDLTFAAVYCHH